MSGESSSSSQTSAGLKGHNAEGCDGDDWFVELGEDILRKLKGADDGVDSTTKWNRVEKLLRLLFLIGACFGIYAYIVILYKKIANNQSNYFLNISSPFWFILSLICVSFIDGDTYPKSRQQISFAWATILFVEFFITGTPPANTTVERGNFLLLPASFLLYTYSFIIFKRRRGTTTLTTTSGSNNSCHCLKCHNIRYTFICCFFLVLINNTTTTTSTTPAVNNPMD